VFLISAILGVIFILIKKQLFLSLFLIWIVIYFLGYALINPASYHWYALHFYFVLEIMAGLGLGWLVNAAFDLSGAKKIAMGFAACLLAALLVIPNLSRGADSVQAFGGDGRAPAYTAIADWLNRNTQPEDDVAYMEIGYLGYYTQNRIIDLAGLTDPLIASHIAEHGFTWGFWHYQPKYFLFHPGMDSEAYLAGVRAAADQYEEVARFPSRVDELPLVLFRRIE
jgi:hypothetical protein